MFSFLYLGAARQAAASCQYQYRTDDDALDGARSKFITDYIGIDYRTYEKLSWEKHLGVTTALVIRACAAYQIIRYSGPILIERPSSDGPKYQAAFNSQIVRTHANEIVALALGVALASFEISRAYRERGYHSANIDALSTVTTQQLVHFVQTIIDDRKASATSGSGIRREFRMVLTQIKLLLKKHYDNAQPLGPDEYGA